MLALTAVPTRVGVNRSTICGTHVTAGALSPLAWG